MFQADDSHTTITSEPPARAIIHPPKYGVTRSQVMTRAWQLAKLNRRTANESGRERLGEFMRMAWGEARRNDTENWTFLSPKHEARCLERQLVTLQYDDRRTQAHYGLMDSLRASISSLRATSEVRCEYKLAWGTARRLPFHPQANGESHDSENPYQTSQPRLKAVMPPLSGKTSAENISRSLP
jgi:hypothetical protein